MDAPWTSPTPILLTRDALARTGNRNELTRQARTEGTLLRLRAGAYVDRRAFARLRPSEQHRVRIIAAHRCDDLQDGAALARESAAIMMGIPLIGPVPERVQLVRPARLGGRLTATTRTLTAPPSVDLTDLAGVPITSAAQTLIDLGRRRSFASTLASMDHCLHTTAVSKEQLLGLLATQQHRPGNGLARRAIEWSDSRAESPGESLSRAVIIENGLAVPDLQRELLDDDGEFLGRVDMLWEEHGVVGEFDGAMKYTRGLTGAYPQEVVVAERRREHALESRGHVRVARWTWADAMGRGTGMLTELARYGVVARPRTRSTVYASIDRRISRNQTVEQCIDGRPGDQESGTRASWPSDWRSTS
ncbi:hypothetical protein AXF14_06380 [Actinomyces radicidentis]|uniref:Transcriptional regulator, AbiEi antitoxin, Type IV TA system n=1 Tax=Actinomyces radicidentis TaxID=111015 RepID=A0A0X8JF37_ACTRD|nr:hypothetical protein [Actinomyces radicidentis]AMD87283.1 hypothetical protein AXF14_06380 [Actinomyces radicidentis]